MARVGQGGAGNIELHLSLYVGAGTQVPGSPAAAFASTLAESWTRSGVARTGTGALWDAGTTGGSLTCMSQQQPPLTPS